MPKKKKRRPQNAGARSRRRTPNQIERLVDAFAAWRTSHGLDPDDAWIIGPLIELKRDYFDIPDPTVWPAQETYELLTSVMPRKVYVEEDDYERIAPAVGGFFTFLHETGRWSPRSIPFDEVPDLVGPLTNDIPDRLARPGGRGMAGNILHHALSQSVDITDEAAFQAFVQQYNAMDDDARRAVSDTGELPSSPGAHPPGTAFGLGAGQPHLAAVPGWGMDDDGKNPYDVDALDEIDFSDVWPEFLGDPPDDDVIEREVTAAEEAEYLTSSVLTQRADHVMKLLAGGRKVTATEVLRRADTLALLKKFGIEESPRSMWDAPPLAILWTALQAGGFVDIQGDWAYPTAAVVPWTGPAGDADKRLLGAQVLHAATLAVVLGMPGDDLDAVDEEAVAAAFTSMALFKAAQPGGVTVSIPGLAWLDPIVADVISALRTLVDVGLVTEGDGETFHFHPSLLELMPAAIDAAVADKFPDDEP